MLWALILHLIRNSSFVFTLAVILGLGCPGPAHSLESMITPAILLMMMLSMMEIDLRAKCNLYDMLMGFGINYLLLSGLIIGLSFFPQDENLRQGFIVMADVPPAVAILPLTKLLDDDSRISLYAETVCYLASLILNPSSSSPSPTVLE